MHEGFIYLVTCLQPKSRGSVTLRSRNISDPPKINPAYLQDSDDVTCTYRGKRDRSTHGKTNFALLKRVNCRNNYFHLFSVNLFKLTIINFDDYSLSYKLRAGDSWYEIISRVRREGPHSRFRRVPSFATGLSRRRLFGVRHEDRRTHEPPSVWHMQDKRGRWRGCRWGIKVKDDGAFNGRLKGLQEWIVIKL